MKQQQLAKGASDAIAAGEQKLTPKEAADAGDAAAAGASAAVEAVNASDLVAHSVSDSQPAARKSPSAAASDAAGAAATAGAADVRSDDENEYAQVIRLSPGAPTDSAAISDSRSKSSPIQTVRSHSESTATLILNCF